MNKGFYFKIFNRYLYNFYPLKKTSLFVGYKYFNFQGRNYINNYSYRNYIRFFNIYNKYINYMVNGSLNVDIGIHEFKSNNIVFRNNKKSYY